MLILVPTTLEMSGIFPDVVSGPGPSRWLQRSSLGEPVDVARCGFGLAAAGARAAALLASRRDDACLAGLAGTYDDGVAPLGSVVLGRAVHVDGIGFGSGAAFVHPKGAAGPMGAEWLAQEPAPPWMPPMALACGALLSVASASASGEDVALRRLRYPACVAEEMEGEAVLHAASALGRRLAIVRGISNVAGRRDPATWRPREAFAALRDALDAWLRP